MKHNIQLLSLVATAVTLLDGRARAATLPVPCAAGTCAGIPGWTPPTGFVTSGAATWSQNGSQLTVNQTTNNATLNWQSFNISSDGKVTFVQPSASSIALNRIWQADPAKIFGSLNANGQIYLINQNGIIFGSTAQVSVGGLLASTLDLSTQAIQSGLTKPFQSGLPALQPFVDSSGNPAVSGAVSVQAGASIQTAETGSVLMFAPQITNEGTIQTPGGQTLLAAGSPVYLASSSDPNIRGLLVEVGTGGTVTNGNAADSTITSPQQLIGQIIANHGNVTLAGLAVNQLGRLSATTTVNENGSIRLQAFTGTYQTGALKNGTGGSLNLGPDSVTEVTLETSDPTTTVDSVPQPKSAVQMYGSNVQIENGSRVTANSGTITVDAAVNQDPTVGIGGGSKPDGSRIYVAPDATLDVSGATVELPASANIIPVQLRGTEFADYPLQRNGPLRGDTVYVDARQYGVLDGKAWQGTPLADVSGEIGAIQRNVAERNLTGGTVSLNSQGDVIVAPTATVNIAGGAIHYDAGYINTTKLITAAGTEVDIANADPNQIYVGIATTTTVNRPRWSVTTIYPNAGGNATTTYQPAYTEGKDAGTFSLTASKFILDGTVDGQVTQGLYQRLPTAPGVLPTGTLYRAYDQVPLTGTLIVGDATIGSTGNLQSLLGDVTLGSQNVLPGLMAAGFNPSQDPLPASYSTSILRTDLIGPQGVGNLEIFSGGTVTLPASTSLSFPAGGSLRLRANTVDLLGSIDAPSGAISATAELTDPPGSTHPSGTPSLTVGAGAELTAHGTWVNDSVALNPNGPTDPLWINGGSVSLTAVDGGNLTLAAGSLIDVSGGAHLTSSGTLVGGSGGTITLATTPNSAQAAPATLDLEGTLRGYAVSQGGTLNLTANSVCIAAVDCTDGDPSELWLTPGRFTSGGFAQYSIASSVGDVTIAPGVTIDVYQQNLTAASSLLNVASSGDFFPLATVTRLPDVVRKPANLTLTANVFSNVPLTEQQFDQAAGLDMEAGATIATDPQAKVNLNSNTTLIVDGTITDPAGSIGLTLGNTLAEANFEQSQAIWLGPQATLDASGIAQIVPNNVGLRNGTVQSGGTITVTAERGYFEMLPGSVMDVSGTEGTIDTTAYVGGRFKAVGMPVASAGGTIDLTAAEGMVLGGTFSAAPGTGAGLTPAGGTLSIVLDTNNRNDQPSLNGGSSLFPTGTRTIVIEQALSPVVISPGSEVPTSLNGEALVYASSVNSAGFDTVVLQSKALQAIQTGLTSYVPGEILFAQNATLRAGQEIELDAASIAVRAGATGTVIAPYVLMGNSDDGTAGPPPAPSGGTGTLNIGTPQENVQYLELFGTQSLQGIGQANFYSSGDIRLRGVVQAQTLCKISAQSQCVTGGLESGGNIALTAAQIYPTTLSQFTVSSSSAHGLIDVQKSGGQPGTVWSAGGTLTLSAPSIYQAGVLRAPFGSIVLESPAGTSNSYIDLAPGSVTSTSAGGLTIPFGTTQGGFDWTFPLPDNQTVVYGTDGIPLPSQHITLNGANVNVEKGATVDVSGGGDMKAYEFVPGTGGTNDVLSASFRPNQYAIVPSLGSSVAPYDPNISNGSTLTVGQSVYLSGAPGLPAGTYTLLPARYALLMPGAFLVSQVSGYTGLASGLQYANAGGGTIVSGYFTIAGTHIASSQTSGFAVIPASVYEQEATYTTSSANQFFTAQAQTAGTTPSRLPVDSGILAIVSSAQQNFSTSLELDGELLGKPGTGGLGSAVDISSAHIEVVADGSTAVAQGALALSAGSLSQLGAQSLLLGGQRSSTGAIETDAKSVTIDSGANLAGPELLFAATDQVTVSNGASLTASGTGPSTSKYSLTGDGAFLSVSASPIGTVTRTNATAGTGVLDLQAGSQLNASQGSVYLDGGNVLVNGTLGLSGADLALQSSQISFGNAPSTTPGTVVGASVLSANDLRSLSLVSRSSIDFYGSVTANTQSLTLDAGGLVGHGGNGDTDVLNVNGTLQLANTQKIAAPAAGSGTGALELNAQNVNMASGNVTVSGFNSVAVNAQGQIRASASSTLSTSGDLALSAAMLTAGPALTLDFTAGGKLSLTAPSNPAALAPVTDLGGAIQLTGQSVEIGTAIDLPAGRVLISSTGGTSGSDVVFDSGANINVAGVTRTYDGVNVAAPGGTVSITSAGNVLLASGSTIDISGATGGNAGSLAIAATLGKVDVNGTLKGAGGGGKGGSFSINAQQIGDAADSTAGFTALNALLNTNGFSGDRSVELRGAGNLVIGTGANDSITGTSVQLIADQGNVTVDGSINASGSLGGKVVLAASGDVTLNGSIDAHATGAGQSGGQVELMTTAGGVHFDSGASINVAGGAADSSGQVGTGGTVLARVPQATVLALAAGGTGVTWAGSVNGAEQTTLEAFVNQSVSGTVSQTDPAMTTLFNNAQTFMSNAGAILASLNPTSPLVLTPGIELDDTDTTAPLTLSGAWNLYNWRFNGNGTAGSGVPGILTVRAADGVAISKALSDGFVAATGTGAAAASAYTLPTANTNSWSYRLVGGADFTSANVLATDSAASAADVTLANGAMVRTGNGFIDVATSGNFVLSNQQSVLYTAGVAGPGITLSGNNLKGGLKGLAYPTGGGDISITAGGNIVGATTNQFVTPWLWRVGGGTSNSATAWTVSFQNFQQGVAALGGGNVSISAGGDITNLSASIPSIGVQTGGTTASASVVEVTGGGNLSVTAGGSIVGGSYYVGRGTGSIEAGGNVGAALNPDGTDAGLAPLLGLGDSQFTVQSRGDLHLSDIVDPTLLPQGLSQGAIGNAFASYYSTYSPDAAVNLVTTGGNILLAPNPAAVAKVLSGEFTGSTINQEIALNILPPTLTGTAFDGDVNVGGTLILFPAPKGNLELFAQGNIAGGSPISGYNYVDLVLSDADPTLLPSIQNPAGSLDAFGSMNPLGSQSSSSAAISPHALVPVHSLPNQPDGEPDLTPARLVAATGDITFDGSGDNRSGLESAKPADVIAGRDIVNLGLVAQNLTSGDVTLITAGRDIVYPLTRNAGGSIVPTLEEVTLDGPGALDLSAGRNANLGVSKGITTEGNLINPALPSGGASVTVTAGVGVDATSLTAFVKTYVDNSDLFDGSIVSYVENLTGSTNLTVAQAKQAFDQLTQSQQLQGVQAALAPHYTQFINTYIEGSGTSYDKALEAYVGQVTGETNLSADAARHAFGKLSSRLQDLFVDQVLFAEITTQGTLAVSSGSHDYRAAFAALTTLFPAVDPTVLTSQSTLRYGDIELYFSRMYTLQGGSISLLAPGGEVNVGLAQPPSSFGITKTPDQLGIVAESVGDVNALVYKDFEVNQSRVFAANGGNILVWSTDGDIDAGRGSKTAISAPPPTITVDANGKILVTASPALAGSGIQALTTTPGTKAGTVSLFAPNGVINANDAGIVAGNFVGGANSILGVNNISFSGTALGLPPPPVALGAVTLGASATATSASSAATSALSDSTRDKSKTPLAESALSWIDVFVIGLGEEGCKPEDAECLKRQHPSP
jgi:filamentous hemagglutinin family protein